MILYFLLRELVLCLVKDFCISEHRMKVGVGNNLLGTLVQVGPNVGKGRGCWETELQKEQKFRVKEFEREKKSLMQAFVGVY
jgi:hypothetical protein